MAIFFFVFFCGRPFGQSLGPKKNVFWTFHKILSFFRKFQIEIFSKNVFLSPRIQDQTRLNSAFPLRKRTHFFKKNTFFIKKKMNKKHLLRNFIDPIFIPGTFDKILSFSRKFQIEISTKNVFFDLKTLDISKNT